jgi:ribulose-phosphate 3-epimerase
VLSADFLHLGQQLRDVEAAGANYVHFDVMDGRFVPNISIGLPVLEAVQRGTSLPIDTHLMIVEPDRWVEQFIDAGADRVTVHVEATPHLHRVIQRINNAGAVAGVSINPATSVVTIEEILPFVGQILVMTVNPGFGGQTFIPTMLAKIARVRAMIDAVNPSCRLQVDGGINAQTIKRVVEAGADTIVAGTAIFNDHQSVADALDELRLSSAGR